MSADVDMDPPLISLPLPEADSVVEWVNAHLDGLFSGEGRRSPAFTGGQTSADAALAVLDIDRYAKRRSTVWPPEARGATKLSPYIRHGLLDLPRVHDHPTVAGADSYDRFRFRGELLWQDYSRQWYAVLGRATRRGVVNEPRPGKTADGWEHEPWWREMACVDRTVGELHTDGWMVNQTRMWLASQWSVRAGADWRGGDDEMFRHLLDGSRAANRQGWQWVVGGVRSRSYGFAKRQVMKRAPEFCAECSLSDSCPIGGYPGSVAGPTTVAPAMSLDLPGPISGGTPSLFDSDSDTTSSPATSVWITAESLGDADPALAAHPGLPVHFVFDEPLLRALRLDAKRLVFLTDCLADLAARRDLRVWRGRPKDLLGATRPGSVGDVVATTRAPVPGFAEIARTAHTSIRLHDWRWLRPPTEALAERLGHTRFPSFKDWCRLTKPSTS